MKPIKMLCLAALAALMAMAFAGASSAMGEYTSLCSANWEIASDESHCEVTHVHESTLSGVKAKLLTSLLTVECDVLFLGDTVEETNEPLVIEGNFTYSNCSSGCKVEEASGGFSLGVLRSGHETAEVTYEGEVHVNCTGINCYYNGEGLVGTDKGPLLSSETNGEVAIAEQAIKKVKGLFCPSTSKLDITTTPLTETYLGGQLVYYCVQFFKPHGYFLNVNNGVCKTQHITRRGNYEIIIWVPGKNPGDMTCVELRLEPMGLYMSPGNGIGCANDHVADIWRYELGEIQ